MGARYRAEVDGGGSGGRNREGGRDDSDRVAVRARGVFGDALTAAPGVLHVAAVWIGPSGALETLKIGPGAPESELDTFALGLARARCDALLTTGRILREEPGLDPALPVALAAWRLRERCLADPPVRVVLTGRGDLDPGHPLLLGPRVLVVCAEPAAGRLRRQLPARVEVVAREAPSLADGLDFLQHEAGLPSVCIEAGPSSTRALYRSARIDELMLSVFSAESPPPLVSAPGFASRTELESCFDRSHRSEADAPSGPWAFERWLRRSAGAAPDEVVRTAS